MTIIFGYLNYPIPDCSGVGMLLHFMDEYSLSQSDLPEIGSQGTIAAEEAIAYLLEFIQND